MTHQQEITSGNRFEFGENWSRYLNLLDPDRIARARKSLQAMLNAESLEGKRFLDIGSGSGLFSLAARQLGAKVHSFDYDPKSVACTCALRDRFFPNDPHWTVEEGSALDRDYLARLGAHEIVYSWGVLHHTGAMWDALANVAPLVAPEGQLFIAIYNDQGRPSRLWKTIKRSYVRLPKPLKWTILYPVAARLWGPSVIRDFLRGRPFETWRSYDKEKARGMDPWRDVVDWVGGYPFEVAKPEEIFDFFRARGFELERLATCAGGLGCNEFVFRRVRAAA